VIDGQLRRRQGPRGGRAVTRNKASEIIQKMALELLRGCGMILRSEKRRLLGMEALGTEATELGFRFSGNCLHAVSTVQVFNQRNRYQACVAGPESMLPLLNLF